ncbi:catalase family peroxidase [Ancylobacter dichloromethanicus]|uniref:catalase family peroxidase n=1 Tax=Ancylobacter dichloromethanicus TaxID=518825 RepID=UPI001BCC7EED|nr:catalase family peroxidase [Ancylobacter dichloromethanicus]MBS7554983.1 catalase family peroxidase [Ancylobacter dichloromethanicus]
MTLKKSAHGRYWPWPPGPGVLAGLGATGLVIAGVAGAFAYTGGLLSPGALTQTRIIDRFQAINGVHPGFRRNHAKGVCVTGTFASNGLGARLSRAAVFAPGSVPVIGRFAVGIGKPFLPDNGTEVRSLALSFRPAGGEEWRTGMNDIPVFPVKDAEGFYALMAASAADPGTGKPDPARMKDFLAAHPETARALALIRARPFSTGFANASYNGLDAFRFVDAAGRSTPVRWSMVALDPFVAQTPPPAGARDPNYLFDDLVARLDAGPLRYRFVVTVGQPGDPTGDATLPWPAGRQQVDAGTLTLDHVEAEGPGNCRDINYDPLVLPDGIAASDDPLLSARSAAYSVSFTRRAGEPKTPSEVQPPPARPAAADLPKTGGEP